MMSAAEPWARVFTAALSAALRTWDKGRQQGRGETNQRLSCIAKADIVYVLIKGHGAFFLEERSAETAFPCVASESIV
jgi:hypothetical protein